jgi:hypothetical protein
LNSICATYDQATGACLSCPYGYQSYGFFCFNVLSTNPYCSAYTGVTCNACQNGYYLNKGICTLANAFCATFNLNGNCLSCITGFTLNGVLCTALHAPPPPAAVALASPVLQAILSSVDCASASKVPILSVQHSMEQHAQFARMDIISPAAVSVQPSTPTA